MFLVFFFFCTVTAKLRTIAFWIPSLLFNIRPAGLRHGSYHEQVNIVSLNGCRIAVHIIREPTLYITQ